MKPSELRLIVDKIAKDKGVSLTEIATAANLNRTHLSTVVNGKDDKQVTNAMIRKLSNEFPGYFKAADKSDRSNRSEMSGNHGTVIGQKEAAGTHDDPKEIALLKLANSNEALARSHEKLVNLLEKKFTENEDQRRLRDAEANVLGVKEFVCLIDSKVNKRPVKDSWEALGTKVDAAMDKLDKTDKSVAAHK